MKKDVLASKVVRKDRAIGELALTSLQQSFSLGLKLSIDKFEPIDIHVSKSRSLRPNEREEELLAHIADEVLAQLEPEVQKAVAHIQEIKQRIYDECSDAE